MSTLVIVQYNITVCARLMRTRDSLWSIALMFVSVFFTTSQFHKPRPYTSTMPCTDRITLCAGALPGAMADTMSMTTRHVSEERLSAAAHSHTTVARRASLRLNSGNVSRSLTSTSIVWPDA